MPQFSGRCLKHLRAEKPEPQAEPLGFSIKEQRQNDSSFRGPRWFQGSFHNLEFG